MQWSCGDRACNLSFRGGHITCWKILMVGPVKCSRGPSRYRHLLAAVLRNASATRRAFRQDTLQHIDMHKEMSADRAWQLLVDRLDQTVLLILMELLHLSALALVIVAVPRWGDSFLADQFCHAMHRSLLIIYTYLFSYHFSRHLLNCPAHRYRTDSLLRFPVSGEK